MIRHQAGYALLIVLATIVIIGLLVPPIAYQIISSSAQANRTEENLQIDRLQDMGKMIAREHVVAALNGNETLNYDGVGEMEEPTFANVVAYFQQTLVDNRGSINITDMEFSNYDGSVSVEFTAIEDDEDENEIEVLYTIIANLGEGTIRSEASDEGFRIGQEGVENGNGNGNGNGSGNGNGEWFDDEEDKISDDLFGDDTPRLNPNGNVKSDELTANAIYDSQLQLSGGESFSVDGSVAVQDGVTTPGQGSILIISEDFYVYKSTVEIKQATTIYIDRDLYLNDAKFDFTQKDSGFVCVGRDIYEMGETEFDQHNQNDPANFVPLSDVDGVDSCSGLNTNDHDPNVYYDGTYYQNSTGPSTGNGSSGWVPIGTN